METIEDATKIVSEAHTMSFSFFLLLLEKVLGDVGRERRREERNLKKIRLKNGTDKDCLF